MSKLNAENLRDELWGTLKEVRSEKISPKVANAVVSSASAIIRTIKTEIDIQRSDNALSKSLQNFTDKDAK